MSQTITTVHRVSINQSKHMTLQGFDLGRLITEAISRAVEVGGRNQSIVRLEVEADDSMPVALQDQSEQLYEITLETRLQ